MFQPFEIVELPPKGYDEKRPEIIYPEFNHLTYYSRTASRETGVNVLLPPGFSENKRYPVLYVLHGYFGNEYSISSPEMSLSVIYNNLLAKGMAKEMIMVLPYIFCDKNMPVCTEMNLTNSMAYDNFVNDLCLDLIPFIRKSLPVLTDRHYMAITGFSMGGREALYIGFTHPELFSYVGAVCPAPGLLKIQDSPMHPGQISEGLLCKKEGLALNVLISSSMSDDVVGTAPDSYRQVLSKNGIEFQTHIMKNEGHDESSVKPHFYNYLRLLFN